MDLAEHTRGRGTSARVVVYGFTDAIHDQSVHFRFLTLAESSSSTLLVDHALSAIDDI